MVRLITLLNEVTETGESSSHEVSQYNKVTFHVISKSVSSGGTMLIQTSLDNTNWATIATISIEENGVEEVAATEVKYKYIRANLSERTDGTYTVITFMGE